MSIPNVLISYNNSVSADLALKLNEKLKFHGIKTWVDVEKNYSGEVYSSVISAIEASDVIIVIVSNEYCHSEICMRECEYAFKKNKYIIPITKDSTNFMPSGSVGLLTSALQYIDFSKGDFDSQFSVLLKKIFCFENMNDYGIKIYFNLFFYLILIFFLLTRF